jgi:hypothetical protein
VQAENDDPPNRKNLRKKSDFVAALKQYATYKDVGDKELHDLKMPELKEKLEAEEKFNLNLNS